jgi:phosphatidylglycerol:prolipoprotein diacylglycerol transferase
MAVNLELAYAGMVLLGVALFALFRPTKQYADPRDRAQYIRLQVLTLVAALLGAKVAVLMGDGLWPLRPFHDWIALLLSGRSIVGALLFGFLAAEIAKPLLGYTLPPNDRFAIVLPFSIATGRLGCWMSGCCLGVESQAPWALTGVDGVSRVPAPLIEMTFHLAAGLGLLMLWRRGKLPGRLFALYLAGYGAFRFVSEYWRVTAKVFGGLSAYQWFALAMVIAGVTALVLRRHLSSATSTALGQGA